MVEFFESDILEQQNMNNIIPCDWNNKITDGQKRYRTLENNSASNYPKVKTMFYILFDFERYMLDILGSTRNQTYRDNYYNYDNIAKELSKYVTDIKKPDIQYTLKQMNQYNRIKYVKTDKKFGDITITFMDVKDSIIQQTFFKYLREIDYDFDNKIDSSWSNYGESRNDYNENWGLKLESNRKMFSSITIAEMFINKLMVYTVHNPVLKSIKFDDNKMGDFSPMNVTVTFSIEGMSNNLLIDGIDKYTDVIGKNINEIGGEDLAHLLQKQWGGNNAFASTSSNNYKEKNDLALKNRIENSLSISKYDATTSVIKSTPGLQEKYEWKEDNTLFDVAKNALITASKNVLPIVGQVGQVLDISEKITGHDKKFIPTLINMFKF